MALALMDQTGIISKEGTRALCMTATNVPHTPGRGVRCMLCLHVPTQVPLRPDPRVSFARAQRAWDCGAIPWLAAAGHPVEARRTLKMKTQRAM
jgi:hypothetical protein